MSYKCEIVADSVMPQGHRLTTYLITYPRIIHAEMCRHRILSRNTASSRAIPFEKMVKMVEEDPFIPIAWQKDHKGMQGVEYFTDDLSVQFARSNWLTARDNAIKIAKSMNGSDNGYDGVTKQLCNRLLEPFMWTTELISGTEWENFFELRCPRYEYYDMLTGNQQFFKSKKDWLQYYNNKPLPKAKHISKIPENDVEWLQINKSQAEIHIQKIAEMMYNVMNESTPKQLEAGEWHIPYSLSDEEKFSLIGAYQNHSTPEMTLYTGIREAVEIEDKVREALNIDTSKVLNIKISTTRCARLSYQTVGDNPKIDYAADIKLHDMLLTSKYFSPFEHCARAMTHDEYYSFRKGFIDMDSIEVIDEGSLDNGWCNNFRGFINYRYLLENKLL